MAFYATFNDFLITEATTGWAKLLLAARIWMRVQQISAIVYTTHFGGIEVHKTFGVVKQGINV